MKLSIKSLLVAVGLIYPSYSLAYEASASEIAEVCNGEQECINIISDELSDITISGNLRHMTPEKFNFSVDRYCDELKTKQCWTYVAMMKKTFNTAYMEGDK